METIEQPVVAKRKGTLAVILGGLATSFLALSAVWLIGVFNADFNVMGWYIMFIVPAGALIVGALAGSGYSFVSWLRGVKITGMLMWSVLALQVLAYAEAQHLEYRMLDPVYPDGTPMPFTTYYDLTTRSMAFHEVGKNQDGGELGVWGYLFRALEAGGFALGGMFPVLLLSAKPFCENCQVYMKTKNQGWLPAGVVPRSIKKKDVAGQQAYESEHRTAFESGVAASQLAVQHASGGDVRAFRDLLASHKPQHKEIQKQTSRIEVQLNYCPDCLAGNVRTVCHTGQGENVQQQELQVAQVDRTFVEQCTLPLG
jgi:hypothetical protein